MDKWVVPRTIGGYHGHMQFRVGGVAISAGVSPWGCPWYPPIVRGTSQLSMVHPSLDALGFCCIFPRSVLYLGGPVRFYMGVRLSGPYCNLIGFVSIVGGVVLLHRGPLWLHRGMLRSLCGSDSAAQGAPLASQGHASAAQGAILLHRGAL